jgi:hypothetical protein
MHVHTTTTYSTSGHGSFIAHPLSCPLFVRVCSSSGSLGPLPPATLQLKVLQDDVPFDLALLLYIGVPVTAVMIVAAIALLVWVQMRGKRHSGYEPLDTPVNVENYDFGEDGYGEDPNY